MSKPNALTRYEPAPVARASSTADPLAFYMEQARSFPLLTTEEEHELAVSYVEDGDKRAGEKLVTHNLRLVVRMAYRYHGQWTNLLDLIQEGNVGLVKALQQYDPYRGVRFSSYAGWWIKAMILRFLLDNFHLLKFGTTRAGRKLFFQLSKERARLTAQGIDPTPALVAEQLGVREDEVAAFEAGVRAPVKSLHAPDADDGSTLEERLDGHAPSPEAAAAELEWQAMVRDELDAFEATLTDPRDQAIWTRRLLATDPESLATLGKDFGVSRERARQLEARLKRRCRDWLDDSLGDAIDFHFAAPASYGGVAR